MRHFFLAVTRNIVSFAGSVLTSASAVLILSLFGIEQVGYKGGPYIGIVTFLVLPAIFVAGLVLIPAGMLLERRRARRAAARGEPPASLPVIDLNRERTRKIVLSFLVLSLMNTVILALATYKGVEIMDSTEFCGSACHTVMAPEYTTYKRSPHARVQCVSCHIGPGAGWFVKSKLSGAWQLIAVAFDLYPRPIPTPVHNLRPARETCEQCHWPTKFVGDRLKVIARYAEDDKNTEKKTVLLMRVGGVAGRTSRGIHWHVDPSIRIRYRADPERKTISAVELTRADGTVELFVGEGDKESLEGSPRASGTVPETVGSARGAVEADAGGGSKTHREAEETAWRTMDCVDCHNRPSHIYRMPRDEIDAALQLERIDRSLPYIRREGLKALGASYASHELARSGIRDAITAFYRASDPDLLSSKAESVEAASQALGDIYCTNVFPWMNIGWGTYPSHIGHENSTGCWRCHDEAHKTASGRTISQDCSVCHSILANEEEDPEVLKQLNP